MGSVESTPPTEKEYLRRQLTFGDVFFLSFGGSSPLLSLLTYGAVGLLLGGYLSPIILVAGTMIVLVNGLIVQRMASRFTTFMGSLRERELVRRIASFHGEFDSLIG
jgi:amino acid transporter